MTKSHLHVNALALLHILAGTDIFRPAVDTSLLRTAKAELDQEFGDRRWALQAPYGPRSRREFLRLAKWRQFLKVPA